MQTETYTILKTKGFEFPVCKIRVTDSLYEYYVCNMKCKPKPVASFSVFLNGGGIIFRDIIYFETCPSSAMLVQTGVVEMLRGMMRAICEEHSMRMTVYFRDTSILPIDTRVGEHAIVPLSEKRFLIHGETWRQEFLGAMPTSETMNICDKYANALKLLVSDTGLMKDEHFVQFKDMSVQDAMGFIMERYGSRFFTIQKVRDMLKLLKLPRMVGSEWYISPDSIMTFDSCRFESRNGKSIFNDLLFRDIIDAQQKKSAVMLS